MLAARRTRKLVLVVLPVLAACGDGEPEPGFDRIGEPEGALREVPVDPPTNRRTLERMAREAAQAQNLDPALVAAVIGVESAWDPRGGPTRTPGDSCSSCRRRPGATTSGIRRTSTTLR